MDKKKLLAWSSLLACMFLVVPGYAATSDKGDPDKDVFRFEFRMVSGVMYKFDRQTGGVEVASLPKTSKGQSGTGKAVKKGKGLGAQFVAQKANRNHHPEILSVGGDVVDPDMLVIKKAPFVITQSARFNARSSVGRYTHSLGVSQLVAVSGDSIKGTLSIRNRGQRRLLALELTIFVPTSGEKIVKHRILMGNRDGQEMPPQPATRQDGKPDPVYLKIKFPAPTGIKGKISTRVTYLKFADE